MAPDEETIKRRYREFLDLLPLTIAVAGLPPSQTPYTYSVEQMEIRVTALANAFRLARQLTRDCVTADT